MGIVFSSSFSGVDRRPDGNFAPQGSPLGDGWSSRRLSGFRLCIAPKCSLIFVGPPTAMLLFRLFQHFADFCSSLYIPSLRKGYIGGATFFGK
jgi:hypothetical protein